MSTQHQYPHVSPPTEQETREDIIERFSRYMLHWEVKAKEWQRQCEQNEESLQRERRAHDRARRWARAWKSKAREHRAASRDWEYHHNDLETTRADINAVLDAAGVSRANWALCDDPACQSKTAHRVREIVKTAATLERQLGETQVALGEAEREHETAKAAYEQLRLAFVEMAEQNKHAARMVAELKDQINLLCLSASHQLSSEVVLVSRSIINALARLAGVEGTEAEGGRDDG